MTRQPTPSILDDVLTTDAARSTQLYAGNIKRDGGTQMRADLDPATVEEYADAMAEAGGWHNFPPVITYHDGTDNWLADGFHRLAAYLSRFSASGQIPADVRSGTRRDAILHAAGANASHGLRRTNADKRRAVETLLRDEEWAAWSNMEIARRCNVDEGTVRKVRKDLESASEIPKVTERHGADGKTYATANIGAKSGPVPQPIPSPSAKEYSAAVPAARVYWSPASAPIPAGWDDDDEAEYEIVLPTWQQPAGQFNAITEINFITRRRVAERLSLERLDNLRHSLQDRRRELWREERHQESNASAISNQQSPISNSQPVTVDVLPPADTPLPEWAQEPAVQPLELRTVGRMADQYVRHLLKQMGTDAALDHVTSMGTIREIERLFSCQTSIARQVATAAGDLLTGIINLDVSTAAEAATVQIIEYDADTPLPEWAQEEAPARVRGYNVLDDYALRDMPAPADTPLPAWAEEEAPTHYTARQPHDERLQPAQRLIALYQAAIDSEKQYGALTGQFSDWLAPKRDLSAMIGQLEHLIAAITHPEEEPPAAD